MSLPAPSSPTSAAGRCRSSTPAAECSPSTPPSARRWACSTSPTWGRRRCAGPGAAAFVDSCLSNDLSRIGPGQAQYTLLLPDGDEAGGVVDDLIVYLHGPDDVLLVPNAANAAEVLRRLADAAPAGVDRHRPARRGRRPRRAGSALAAGAGAARACPGELPYMSFVTGTGAHGAAEVTVCRTGYTGEHGYELLVDADRAGELWDAAPRGGAGPRHPAVRPRRPRHAAHRDGLSAARPRALAGHHAQPGARGWAVGWKKPAFWGREALLAEKEAGPAAAAVGPAGDRPGHPAPGHGGAGRRRRARSARSPAARSRRRLRTGIALALLDTAAGVEEGAEVAVDVRGRPQAVEVVQAAVRAVARALSRSPSSGASGRCRPSCGSGESGSVSAIVASRLAHRLRLALGGVVRRLVLGLGVDLRAQQHQVAGQVQPQHQHDDAGDRAVGLVVGPEVVDVEAERRR